MLPFIMEIKTNTYTIEIHRASETSHEEEVRRFATYVSIICELGFKQEKARANN